MNPNKDEAKSLNIAYQCVVFELKTKFSSCSCVAAVKNCVTLDSVLTAV